MPLKSKKKKLAGFRLTYATMFDPPLGLHRNFEKALARVKTDLGCEYPMLVGGKERLAAEKFEDRSPIDHSWLLGTFQKGTARDAKDAIAAAR
ncbi:MAG: hypothetical protein Q8Q85_13005, partial [Gemmatimonadales bacterium]|nr:hypothetical protein [Gemmatimonadales bacterium]